MGDSDLAPWVPSVSAAEGERVADVGLERAVREAVGTASMCWADPAGAGEFDSGRAAWVADGLIAHLRRLDFGLLERLARAVWAFWRESPSAQVNAVELRAAVAAACRVVWGQPFPPDEAGPASAGAGGVFDGADGAVGVWFARGEQGTAFSCIGPEGGSFVPGVDCQAFAIVAGRVDPAVPLAGLEDAGWRWVGPEGYRCPACL